MNQMSQKQPHNIINIMIYLFWSIHKLCGLPSNALLIHKAVVRRTLIKALRIDQKIHYIFSGQKRLLEI